MNRFSVAARWPPIPSSRRFPMQFLRHLLIFVANNLPRYQIVDSARRILYRLSGLAIGDGTRISGPLILDLSLTGNTRRFVSIGRNVFINYNCRISANMSRVEIGNDCLIGPNVSFETAGHNPGHTRGERYGVKKPITIGNNFWIGANAVILPGVSVADNCIVAAGAVVTTSFKDEGLVVGGVPARVIRRQSPIGS